MGTVHAIRALAPRSEGASPDGARLYFVRGAGNGDLYEVAWPNP
jgi:hypothetical protein